MPRTARLVVPAMPHHVIQRGNRRQDVFFTEDDYRMYLACLRDQCEKHELTVTAYCLMSNHIHLVVTPSATAGLRPIGEAHRRYARYLNAKMHWTGYLWQGRFGSYPMDEAYAYEAVRYVELNPVRAGLCAHPADYCWSSARQRIHRNSARDYAVAAASFLAIDDWEHYWQASLQSSAPVTALFQANETALKPMRTATTTPAVMPPTL